MSTYALIEIIVVATLVGASAFAMALRLLPAVWLKSPIGAWLDRDGRPEALRRVGVRWRTHADSGCANGCCASGDGCAIGRRATVARPSKRIPILLVSHSAGTDLL